MAINANASTPISIDVGRCIALYRRNLKLSQEKLAELAGCHRNNIGLIERGESLPSIHTIEAIAHALDMKASELLKLAGH